MQECSALTSTECILFFDHIVKCTRRFYKIFSANLVHQHNPRIFNHFTDSQINMAKTYKIMYVPQSLHPLPNRFSYFPKKSGIFKSLTVAAGGSMQPYLNFSRVQRKSVLQPAIRASCSQLLLAHKSFQLTLKPLLIGKSSVI